MVLLKNYKLKASSITESIIAMVIITICLAIAMIVYVRVLDTDRNIASYNAEQKVKELLLETKVEKQLTDEDYSFSTYKIYKKVDELIANKTYKIEFLVEAGKHKETYKYIIAY